MYCRVINETDVSQTITEALKKSLCVCYPEDVEIFSQVAYWRSIPSYRVFIETDDEIIAHIAVTDRTISIGPQQVHVAGVQTTFVMPQYRGKGLMDKIFPVVMEQAISRAYDLSMLFCKPSLEKYYNKFGYKILADRKIVYIDMNGNKGLLPDYNITMWAPVNMKNIPAGNIDLKGRDW